MQQFLPVIPRGWRFLCVSEVVDKDDLCCADNGLQITTERIAFEAKMIWHQKGQPTGQDKVNWLEAENKLFNSLWRPVTKAQIGERWWAGRHIIRKNPYAAAGDVFNAAMDNQPFTPVETTKDKVAKYLEKFVKKT